MTTDSNLLCDVSVKWYTVGVQGALCTLVEMFSTEVTTYFLAWEEGLKDMDGQFFYGLYKDYISSLLAVLHLLSEIKKHYFLGYDTKS